MKLHCIEFSKPFSLAADTIFMLLWFPWYSLLAPVTEVGPDPVLQTPPVLQLLQLITALPLPAVLCLLFILLFILYDEYTALHCSSPVPQDSRQSCGSFAKPHCRDIVPLFFPLCSAQAGFCSSPLQVRTKEHLALNQAGFITCYGNFHNTNIKIIGQDSISPSATVAKVIKDGFRRCCSTSYCALQGLMSLWWRNAGKVSENHQK